MADKNWPKCVVCGKQEKIMKRCGRCQSIFYCSLECQKFDWVKHKNNCIKVQEVIGGSANAATGTGKVALSNHQTETKFKVINCVNKLQRFELNENTGQHATHTNIGHFEDNYTVISSPVDVDLAERLLSQDMKARAFIENDETIGQRTDSEDTVNKLKEDQKANIEKQSLTGSNKLHELAKTQDKGDTCACKVNVCVKYSREKHQVEIGLPCSGLQVLKCFSHSLHIPLERLKVIHKGKLQTESTILETIKANSVFLAFGEMAESEDGLEPDDIELIMKQLSVERNVAIKALRKTNCLLDAIFEIGNNI